MTPATTASAKSQTHAASARSVPSKPAVARGDALVVTFFLISFAVTCLFCLASAIAQWWG